MHIEAAAAVGGFELRLLLLHRLDVLLQVFAEGGGVLYARVSGVNSRENLRNPHAAGREDPYVPSCEGRQAGRRPRPEPAEELVQRSVSDPIYSPGYSCMSKQIS